MKKKKIIIGAFFALLNLAFASIAIGQASNNLQSSKKQLIERIEKAIKSKESRFTGGRSGGWGEFTTELQSNVSWKFGEAYINAFVSDYNTESDANTYFKVNYSEKALSPLRSYGGIKLTNLGDEAWMIVSDSKNVKNGNTQIALRKGSVIMLIRGTSTSLAKRFARYFVREIEKRDRGEP